MSLHTMYYADHFLLSNPVFRTVFHTVLQILFLLVHVLMLYVVLSGCLLKSCLNILLTKMHQRMTNRTREGYCETIDVDLL